MRRFNAVNKDVSNLSKGLNYNLSHSLNTFLTKLVLIHGKVFKHLPLPIVALTELTDACRSSPIMVDSALFLCCNVAMLTTVAP